MTTTIRTYSSSTLLVLEAADRAYYRNSPGRVSLAEHVELGERNDSLADFIHSELRDVTSLIRGKVMPVDEAIGEAQSALNIASNELQLVAKALQELEIVLPQAGLDAVLACINESYYGGEMRLDEELGPGERGDTLADYLSYCATSRRCAEGPRFN